MAVKLRLTRIGAKKKPAYRVVVADSRNSRDGRFLETIGRYDPTKNPVVFEINNERLDHWINVGAQMTETLKNLVLKDRRESAKVSV
ncbi:MAG: 30S ribosomal protein S16 [Pseudomonadota bacterium]